MQIEVPLTSTARRTLAAMRPVLHGFLAAAVTVGAGAPAHAAPQGSITLRNSSAELCHHNDTAWEIAKSGSVAEGTATWTVTVTRGATTDNELVVDGYVQVQNTGTAAATIGNIVVNLQRQVTVGKKTYWISAAADVADATAGDAATAANIVAAGSAESAALNASNGPMNYALNPSNSANGVFSEGAGSGALEFTDAVGNTAFSLTPQKTLAPGETVDLLFSAAFNNSQLNIPAGASVRAEILVTFGNAGARGGSGASAQNIDINGSGAVNADESNVRTVPTRITRTVPALEACNDSVTLSDTADDISATGTVTFSNFSTDIGEGAGTQVVTESGTFTTSVDVDGGADGGTIANTAYLSGESDDVVVNGPIDPATGLPIYSYTFSCCTGVSDEASSVLDVGATDDGFSDGDYFTYNRAKWGQEPHGGNAGTVTTEDFAAIYGANGVVIGGGFTAKWTTPAAIQAFLPNGGTGGFVGMLTANLVDPTSTPAKSFAAEVLALRLNVDYGDNGALVGTVGDGIGDLTLVNTGGSLDGMTVRQVLGVANTALGGGALPAGYTVNQLEQLIKSLNGSFESGNVSAFAIAHLSE